MPRKCCVPKCKSNFESFLKKNKPVSTFSFPKDEERRKKWLSAIPRDDWLPSASSSVCAKHFNEECIIKTQPYKAPDGRLQQLLLNCPRLTDTAVPTRFENLPSCLSKKEMSQRTDPEHGMRIIVDRQKQQMQEEPVEVTVESVCVPAEVGEPSIWQASVKKEDEDEEELQPLVAVFLDPREVIMEEMQEEQEDPLATCEGEPLSVKVEGSSVSAGGASETQAPEGSGGETIHEEHPYSAPRHCARPFTCVDCHKSFKGRSGLVRHRRVHTGEKKHYCSVCQKSFARKGSLLKHMRIHPRERNYCSVCQKNFTQHEAFVRHMRFHTREKPHRCSICLKSFVVKGNLNRHIRLHSEEKRHFCKHCRKSFTQRGQLVSHVCIHAREKDYICSVCHKSFTYKGNLIRHVRTHTGEKLHLCSVCLKIFTQRGQLVEHMLSHTGKKLHFCAVCMKSFTRRDWLVSHMRFHKRENKTHCSDL